jgi:hypothetical protein
MGLQLAQYDVAAADPVASRPRGAQEIDLAEAHRRSGHSDRHLRRLCVEKWLPAGLARLVNPPDGGKPQWYVWDYADPKLARVAPAALVGADLSRFTDAQRAVIAQRLAILDAWDRALASRHDLGLCEKKATDQFCLIRDARGEKPPVKRATLYRWRRLKSEGGPAALADERKEKKEADPATDAIFERVKHLYLTRNELSLRLAYEIAATEAIERGEIPPHYTTLWRRLKTIPKPILTLKRKGREAYTNDHEPYLERDYTSISSNDIWCGDHHRLDLFVRHGSTPDGKPRYVRPWLTAWQDVRSRVIVGYHLAATDPNTDTILRAFKTAALAHGLPGEVMIDNGKDYDARALQGMTKKQRQGGTVLTESAARLTGVFPLLSVRVQHVQPYHGQSKPIERFFRTLADRFARLFETYCGNSPDARPEDLAGRLDAAPTLEELQRDFADWLDADYHRRPHTGDGMDGKIPLTVFAECLVTRRAATPEQLAFACMPRVGPVTVGQHGVTYKGLNYGGFSAEVAAHHGRQVMLAVDLDDLSKVILIDLEGRPLCRAAENGKMGFGVKNEDLRAGIADKRRTRKVVDEYTQRRTRLVQDTRDAAIRAARQRAKLEAAPAAGPDQPPPTTQLVRTPFDASLRQLAELRPAAGQEALSAARDVGPVRFAAPAAPVGDDYTDVSFRDLAARRRGGRRR